MSVMRSSLSRVGFAAVVLAGATLLCSCGGVARGPYTPQMEEFERNIPQAQDLFKQAMAAMDEHDLDGARALLHQALNADLYHGPAHNNLGVIYMRSGELYQAASEFTWARKLMPGHPDPRVNLAAALDAGGQHDSALAAARAALEVQPGYMPAMQAIALIHVRERDISKETLALLDEIAYRGENTQWRDWATLWSGKLAERKHQLR